MKLRSCLLAASALLGVVAGPARASEADGSVTVRLTPAELLATAERMVLNRQFEAAKPLVAALAATPEYTLERRFLTGYIAVETGHVDEAIAEFRAILASDPKQTRVRLELARALMMKGDRAAADHHYRLASQDKNLPPEIAATIRSVRGVIRDRRNWHLNVDFGLAPDSNINNATAAETVDLNVSPNNPKPFILSPNARSKSGVGETASFSGGLRFHLDKETAWLVDGDGQFVNYPGKTFDDYMLQFASGPEFKLSRATSLSVEGVALQRWYGGVTAQRQFGVKTGLQSYLDEGKRVGLQVDIRHTDSDIRDGYDGWTYAAYGTFERVIARSMVASASLFARRESLKAPGYSDTEGGMNLGIGGELPHGINAGLSGGVSYAGFDAAVPLFSSVPRHDWRINARAYLGLRGIRVLGFSPSITYTFNDNISNYDFYRTHRHQVRFELAHYF